MYCWSFFVYFLILFLYFPAFLLYIYMDRHPTMIYLRWIFSWTVCFTNCYFSLYFSYKTGQISFCMVCFENWYFALFFSYKTGQIVFCMVCFEIVIFHNIFHIKNANEQKLSKSSENWTMRVGAWACITIKTMYQTTHKNQYHPKKHKNQTKTQKTKKNKKNNARI